MTASQKNSPRQVTEGKDQSKAYHQYSLFDGEKSSMPDTLDFRDFEHAFRNKMPFFVIKKTSRVRLNPQRVIGTTAYLTEKVTVIARYHTKTLTVEDLRLILEILEGKRHG